MVSLSVIPVEVFKKPADFPHGIFDNFGSLNVIPIWRRVPSPVLRYHVVRSGVRPNS